MSGCGAAHIEFKARIDQERIAGFRDDRIDRRQICICRLVFDLIDDDRQRRQIGGQPGVEILFQDPLISSLLQADIERAEQ